MPKTVIDHCGLWSFMYKKYMIGRRNVSNFGGPVKKKTLDRFFFDKAKFRKANWTIGPPMGSDAPGRTKSG